MNGIVVVNDRQLTDSPADCSGCPTAGGAQHGWI